eukprot:g787.t1
MGKLSSLVPVNVVEEKETFLRAIRQNEVYNPIFKYASPSSAKKTRSKYDAMLSDEYLGRAIDILESVIRDYKSEAAYQNKNWGDQLETDVAKAYVKEYVKLDTALQKHLNVLWSDTAFCTSCCESTVTFVQRKNYYRDVRLKSLLDHEIGTHWTRTYNMNLITGKRKKGGKRKTPFPRLGWLLSTEEGLASLNTTIHYVDKRLFGSSLLYLSCYLSSKMSFYELWMHLKRYLNNNEERLWYICMRVKRGVEDTSQKKGFYKDQSTLSGALRLLSLRHVINFKDLHLAKCSLEELALATPFIDKLKSDSRCLLPIFLKTDKQYKQYIQELDKIAIANNVGTAAKNVKSLRCRRIPYIKKPSDALFFDEEKQESCEGHKESINVSMCE